MIEMNCIIPFEKKLSFAGNIKEIVSISLEHEVTQNEGEVLGNFIVSGTYKEHELSVNTEDFKFVVPFSVELERAIDKDSFDFWIDNFTYDIDGNQMIVKIDYAMCADERAPEEEIREEPVDLIIPEADLEDIKEESEDSLEEKKAELEEIEISEKEEIKEEVLDRDEDTIVAIDYQKEDNYTSGVLSSIDTEEDYITFKIHIVKEEETLESICLNNNVDKEELLKLNDIMNVAVNDKIIIPYKNE